MNNKYVFILSEDNDVSVDKVISWIMYYNKYNVVRINTNDKIRFINITIADDDIKFNIILNDHLKISSKDIYSYWYRRGEIKYVPIQYFGKLYGNIDIGTNISKYYSLEFEHTIESLHYLLAKNTKIKINSFKDINTNKIVNLEIAQECGLKIPKTLISNCPNEIEQFILKHKKCIVKPIRYPGYSLNQPSFELHYSQYSNIIDIKTFKKEIVKYASIQPTQFQEYICKEFEIRSFFLNSNYFSMAIFSQSNEKTKIDFRNYDNQNPNRNIPYSLPKYIEQKLIMFSQKIGINCGSIDLIYSNGSYCFLEINPVGQFDWLSKNCYYNIELEIAKTLIGHG